MLRAPRVVFIISKKLHERYQADNRTYTRHQDSF